MHMIKNLSLVLILTVTTLSGCSKKHIMPAVITGVGGTLIVSGTVYRLSRPNEQSSDLLGSNPQEKAITGSLFFSGLALMTAGIIWSALTPICESDNDCWLGDYCNKATGTCVPKTAPSEEKNEQIGEQTSFLQSRFNDNLELQFDPTMLSPSQ